MVDPSRAKGQLRNICRVPGNSYFLLTNDNKLTMYNRLERSGFLVSLEGLKEPPPPKKKASVCLLLTLRYAISCLHCMLILLMLDGACTVHVPPV